MKGFKQAIEQLSFLWFDFKLALGKNRWRFPYVLLSRSFIGIFTYRTERALFLLFGKPYAVFRILLLPFLLALYWYSNCEIHYHAIIGKGIKILHPSLGVVVSGKAKIGNHLTMVGGNCIGITASKKMTPFVLGNNIEMGVNSTIIGPLQLGNDIKIGANACVIHSYTEDTLVLVGIPAIPLNGDRTH